MPLSVKQLILASAVFAHSVAFALEIETVSQWNRTDAIFYIGSPTRATATYGQTFSVEVDSMLTDWRFWLSNQSAGPQPQVRFDAYLAEWSGDRAFGPILFASTELSVPTSPRGEFHELHLVVPHVRLLASHRYVMFLNTSEYASLAFPIELASFAATSNIYAGGEFWYQNSNNVFANVFTSPWTCADEGGGCRYGDAAFSALLSPVPEVPGLHLGIAGLALIASIKSRHRRLTQNAIETPK